MEAAFTDRRKDALVFRLKILGGIAFCAGLFAAAFNIFVLKHLERSTFPTDVAHRMTVGSLYCLAALLAVITLTFAALSSERLMQCVRPVVLETVAVVLIIVVMIGGVLREPAHVTQILGYDVRETFGDQYFSDSDTVLMIDGFITAVHLGCPLRWCSLFPLEVAGVTLYLMIIAVIGSFEPMVQNVYNCFFLTSLVFAAALGKRAMEMGERQAFLDIIKEKSLRCRAEYQLAQVTDAQHAQRKEEVGSDDRRQRSNGGSAHTASPSNKIFDKMYDTDSNLAQQLANVAELGEAEHWRIGTEEVELLSFDVLGTGAYGRVMKGIFCGVVVAVKIPHDKLDNSAVRKLPTLCNELRILRRIRHPNVVGFHGAVVDPKACQIALVMELVRGMVLKEYLRYDNGIEPGAIGRYHLMFGVCNALLYLHTRQPPIVHGDLKSGNIIAQRDGDVLTPKLLDFGLSRIINRRSRRMSGTLVWMAPEVFQLDAPPKCSADVYSFGRLMGFIATSIHPMTGLGQRRVKRLLSQGRPPMPTWPEGCVFEPCCRTLVQSCLRTHESDRPPIAYVHRRLVAMPQDLDLCESHWDLLEDVRMVAEQLRKAQGATDSPQRVYSRQSLTDAAHAESCSRCRLPSLLQEERPQEGSGQLVSPLPPKRRIRQTTYEAMVASLCQTISTWSYEVPADACCHRHAGLALAQKALWSATMRPCHGSWQHQSWSQCPKCGILGVTDGICETCAEMSAEQVCTRMTL